MNTQIKITYYSYASGRTEVRHFDYVREARRWIQWNRHYIDVDKLKWETVLKVK